MKKILLMIATAVFSSLTIITGYTLLLPDQNIQRPGFGPPPPLPEESFDGIAVALLVLFLVLTFIFGKKLIKE